MRMLHSSPLRCLALLLLLPLGHHVLRRGGRQSEESAKLGMENNRETSKLKSKAQPVMAQRGIEPNGDTTSAGQ